MADDMMTDAEFAAATAAMTEAGRRDGAAAGSWIADGNTSEASLRELLRRWDEGDPAAPGAPSPFSGEWADGPTVRDVIDRETDCDPETITPDEEDELAGAYEEAFGQAWQEEAERTVRALLGL